MRKGSEERNARHRQWREHPLLRVGRWVVFRFDELNYVLTNKPGDETAYRYYTQLSDAIHALLREQIADTERPGIEELMRALQSAEESIVSALHKCRYACELLVEKRESNSTGEPGGGCHDAS